MNKSHPADLGMRLGPGPGPDPRLFPTDFPQQLILKHRPTGLAAADEAFYMLQQPQGPDS